MLTTIETLKQRAAELSTLTGDRYEVRAWKDGSMTLVEHTTNNEHILAETIDTAMFWIRGALHVAERADFYLKHAA